MLINVFIVLATVVSIASAVKYWPVRDWLLVSWAVVALYGIALVFTIFFKG